MILDGFDLLQEMDGSGSCANPTGRRVNFSADRSRLPIADIRRTHRDRRMRAGFAVREKKSGSRRTRAFKRSSAFETAGARSVSPWQRSVGIAMEGKPLHAVWSAICSALVLGARVGSWITTGSTSAFKWLDWSTLVEQEAQVDAWTCVQLDALVGNQVRRTADQRALDHAEGCRAVQDTSPDHAEIDEEIQAEELVEELFDAGAGLSGRAQADLPTPGVGPARRRLPQPVHRLPSTERSGVERSARAAGPRGRSRSAACAATARSDPRPASALNGTKRHDCCTRNRPFDRPG